MPRHPRLLIPGAAYHAYCRIARSESAFGHQRDYVASRSRTDRHIRGRIELSLLGVSRTVRIQGLPHRRRPLQRMELRHPVDQPRTSRRARQPSIQRTDQSPGHRDLEHVNEHNGAMGNMAPH